ncbi:hypothetical protein ABTN67_21185, partial [Acinetobacter baumannii]
MKDIDYGLTGTQTTKSEQKWSEKDTANPLADIEKAIETVTERGHVPEAIVLNSKTFGYIKNAKATVKAIKPLAPEGSIVTKAELKS